ncbi:hypothetical protein JS82_06240 [Methanomassiliicoccaceae archaeon DOK]|nr:hypothetical protein JS82_06240 [Methanomassiliicoccaceae archaeon DOK]
MAMGLSSGSGASEHIQMDALAYSSRMLNWAPLGKLLLVIVVLIANVMTDSVVTALAVLAIGLALMAYSTNMRIPFMLGVAIGEAILILIVACGIISINGDTSQPCIWRADFLWLDLYMTADSFNQAWLVMIRAVAGITVMMAFATSTPIPHLAQALRQIRIPDEICEIVVLIYRYAFLLLERMDTMWSAANSRLGFSGFKRSMKTIASIAVGIFTSSMNMADKAQVSLECRGYRGYFPIWNRPQRAGVGWVAAAVAVFALLYVLGTYTEGVIDFAGLAFGV